MEALLLLAAGLLAATTGAPTQQTRAEPTFSAAATTNEEIVCRVKFGAVLGGDVGGMTLQLDYGDLDGVPVVVEGQPDCSSLHGFAEASFVVVQGDRIEVVFSGRGPKPCQQSHAKLPPDKGIANHAHTGWAQCHFRVPHTNPATRSDFSVDVLSVRDRLGNTIGGPGTGSVGRVSCEGIGTSSSSGTSSSTQCTTTSTIPPSCGDPDADQEVTATDALVVLRASVASIFCSPSVCDVAGANGIFASDALLVLKVAVGTASADLLDCPT
jgi:hypothetical protein